MSGTTTTLLGQVRRRLAASGREPTAHAVAEALRAECGLADTGTVLTLVSELRRESQGAGPLEDLLRIDGVTDVLVNGTAGVYVDRGEGLERSDVTFETEGAVARVARRLAARAGRRLDDASPWVDARLPDGTRLHAVLAPVARPGTVISLRVPARRAFTLADLVAAGTLTEESVSLLRRLVRSRAAFVVTGGTGSGKTTLLAAMLADVPAADRIVVVEDSSELRPDHPHVVALEARPANVEGAGTVTLRDLVRQALRMRPDRLVVGEVRGAEVVDLLAALNTGHEGGCATLHANSTTDVPARFEALGTAAGLDRVAVHSQLGAGVAAVVHLGRDADGRRRLREVAELRRSADGLVRCVGVGIGHDGRRRGSAV